MYGIRSPGSSSEVSSRSGCRSCGKPACRFSKALRETVCRFPRQIDRGLSPQVRGNPIPAGRYPCGGGSIPAGAGEPPAPSRQDPSRGVYPRRCGGTSPMIPATRSARGLSPQVRGNHRNTLPVRPRRGSIPAGAGEPGPLSCRPRPPAVYPRRCGGTDTRLRAYLDRPGLSPQVRGNLERAVQSVSRLGSIPAGAGEPPSTRLTTGRCECWGQL